MEAQRAVFVRGGNAAEKRLIGGGLVVAAFLISMPILSGYINQHFDTLFHMMRIEGIKDGLLSGTFPVRIQPTWLNGHGYAVSVFYGDVFLYLPALLRIVGIPVGTAYSVYVIGINAVTLVTGYYCFREISGNKFTGLAASVLYSGSICRLAALYSRNAMGKSTAMIFYPVILYGLWKIFTTDQSDKKYKNSWIILMVGYTGVIQSHTISTLFAAVLTLVVCLLQCKKTFNRQTFPVLLKAMLSSVLINLWFLVPFMDYMRYDWIGNVHDATWGARFARRAVYLPQLFMTDYHVMGEVNGIADGINGEMPFSIGLAGLFILAASFVLKGQGDKQKKKQEYVCWILIVSVLFLTSTLCPWKRICERIPGITFILRGIQYPWRMLAVIAVLLAWLFCIVLEKIKYDPALQRMVMAVILIIGIVQIVDYNSKILNEQNGMIISQMGNECFYQVGGEYLPVDADTDDYVDRLTVEGEYLDVKEWTRDYNRITACVCNSGSEDGFIEVPLINYKGYRATDLSTGEPLLVQNGKSMRAKVVIPAGYNGSFQVFFKSPWYWRLAEMISLLAIAGGIGYLWLKKGKGRLCLKS